MSTATLELIDLDVNFDQEMSCDVCDCVAKFRLVHQVDQGSSCTCHLCPTHTSLANKEVLHAMMHSGNLVCGICKSENIPVDTVVISRLK